MKYCDKCDVHVSDVHNFCPLCQSALKGEGQGDIPLLPSYEYTPKSESLSLLKMIKFIFFFVGVASVFVNILHYKSGFWSLIVILTVSVLWVWLSIAIKIRRNIIKKFFQLVFLSGAFAVILDCFTGFRMWSLNYVVPILITTSIIIISFVARVLKIEPQERIFYLFLLIVIGLSTAMLMMSDIVTVLLPSYISLFICVFSFSYTIVFERHRLFSELKKRFHI